jgi:2'-5' RNA ligase
VTEQGSLFEAPPAAAGELYFAILPTADAAARIGQAGEQLRSEHGLAGRLRTGNFHISVAGVGAVASVPPSQLQAVMEAASSVALPAFPVVLDRALTFTGSFPLVLQASQGLDAVPALGRALQAAVAKVLKLRLELSSAPHLTVLYSNKALAARPIEPVRWAVADFVLVRNHPGESRLDILGRFPLRG